MDRGLNRRPRRFRGSLIAAIVPGPEHATQERSGGVADSIAALSPVVDSRSKLLGLLRPEGPAETSPGCSPPQADGSLGCV